ncbi:hypothetical protein RD792_003278 [Penstemon davidsonii]|uniref:RING-type E3 ubiquitin transferase n=1 Tax=Penstemon davidsonii TaxID=160366 RepID=A0ABR0DTC2_9LAMI|nr:hypothetical protein RD792_003278 [Penstemon davidsonii]
MDLTSLRCLINSISRFIHLVTCQISKTMPAETDYINVVSLLKHLKPLLDDVADQKAPQDEALFKECEELDIAVNEAREFLEKWSPKMSKILSFCMQESPNLKLGKLSDHLEEILRSQKEGKIPSTEHLSIITESLGLRSNQELLSEFIAVEKERQRAEDNKTEELDQISQIIDLMSHIRGYVVKLEKLKKFNGIQIPSYFLCPLSSELMSDPVIVASGQTFQRASIKKWLDHGLVTCPKTRNKLSHKNLIPNYTVKALIANWCKENNVELSSNPDDGSVQLYFEHTRSSVENENGIEARNEEETEKFDESSPEHSYVHSRSESASSAVSSIDYHHPTGPTEISRISSKKDDVNDNIFGDENISSPQNRISLIAPSLSGKTYNSSKTMAEMVKKKENHNPSRTLSFSPESVSDNLATISHVDKLVKDLKSASKELQISAAGELRFLAKHNMENRFIIGQCGAIAPLISLLHSDVELIQEHAVTALLNLSINEKIKARIAEEGALEPLIHVLKTGNGGAKENAAAALFSISLLDEYRIKIGRSGAVKALVDLLQSGTVRGKKDAATALFNLSIFHENKARIVQAGAVKYLVGLMDPSTEMVDKAVAILANLSTITEGCTAIAREEGIPLLVEIVETGSQRGKENAASILLQMCVNSPKYCRSVLQEGAVPPLVALSQSGTLRAKEKAQQLLSHFRNQRESAVARGRS